MGLDVVELVMEIEDEFNVAIADEDYEHLGTAGDMYEYILRKKGDLIDQPSHPRVCLTMVTFALLRSALTQIAGVARRSIRTMTTLQDLVPQSNRRADWEQLQTSTGLKLPSLRRPPWVVCSLTACAVGISLSIVWLLTAIIPLMVSAVFVVALVLPLLAKLLEVLSREHAIVLPTSCNNVGDFSRSVLALNYGILQEKYYGWGSGNVWDTLRGIISEQLGVPIEDVTPAARFVEDLGAD